MIVSIARFCRERSSFEGKSKKAVFPPHPRHEREVAVFRQEAECLKGATHRSAAGRREQRTEQLHGPGSDEDDPDQQQRRCDDQVQRVDVVLRRNFGG